MNSREQHPPGCECSMCVMGDNDFIIDLTSYINTEQVYALNEKVEGNCRKIFKQKGDMLDKKDFTESNDDDVELMIYIPFKEQCRIKTMTMIGGEDGTAPSVIKLYVNNDNPGFELLEEKPTQTIECVENPLGELPYTLSPSKFNSTWSITVIVTMNYSADHSKIYYIGFEGISTRKKAKVLIGNYELKPLPENVKQPSEFNQHSASIYA